LGPERRGRRVVCAWRRAGGRGRAWTRPRTGPSHCARVGRRLPAAFGGRRRSKGRASGGPLLRGWGVSAVVSVRAVGRLRPGSPSRRRLKEADRPGGVKAGSLLLWSRSPAGHRQSGLLGCARDATGESGTTPSVCKRIRGATWAGDDDGVGGVGARCSSSPTIMARVIRFPPCRGCVFGPPAGRRAQQPGRFGGVKQARRTTAGVMRLDAASTGAGSLTTMRRGTQDTGPQAATATRRRDAARAVARRPVADRRRRPDARPTPAVEARRRPPPLTSAPTHTRQTAARTTRAQ